MPIALGILIYIVLLLSLTVHEFAHAFVADRLGDHTARHMGRLTLNPIAHMDPIGTVLFPLIMLFTSIPLFGWAKPVPVNPMNLRRQSDHMWVAAAGPLSNFALCILCILLYRTFFVDSNIGAGNDFAQTFLFFAAVLNAVLGTFNLIPIPPLDGSRVMAELLPPALAEKYQHLEPFGMIILLGLMFLGVLRLVIAPIQGMVQWLLHVQF